MNSTLGHVDQIGSLLRPERLREARRQHYRRELTGVELAQIEDESIRDAIHEQELHGLPVVTDGEFRRVVFMDSFSEVEGFPWRAVSEEFFNTQDDPTSGGKTGRARPRVAASGRLSLIRNRPLEEFQFSSKTASRPVKVTIVGPERICRMAGIVSPASRNSQPAAGSREVTSDDVAFENETKLLPDVVRVLREMIGQLVEAGCTYIHIDESGYTSWVDPAVVEAMRARGQNPEERLARLIEADNAVIDGFPGVTFGIHLCRGNEGRRWHREGGYDPIAEPLFNQLHHQRLLLEYDTERAGDFSPLRFVPASKTAVLGLVTTKDGRIETREELERRLEEAAKYIALDHVAISPQCGFSSVFQSGPVSDAEQWRKFDVLVDTANHVWGSTTP